MKFFASVTFTPEPVYRWPNGMCPQQSVQLAQQMQLFAASAEAARERVNKIGSDAPGHHVRLIWDDAGYLV